MRRAITNATTLYLHWDAIARDRASFLAWMDAHVLRSVDHRDFLGGLLEDAA